MRIKNVQLKGNWNVWKRFGAKQQPRKKQLRQAVANTLMQLEKSTFKISLLTEVTFPDERNIDTRNTEQEKQQIC